MVSFYCPVWLACVSDTVISSHHLGSTPHPSKLYLLAHQAIPLGTASVGSHVPEGEPGGTFGWLSPRGVPLQG